MAIFYPVGTCKMGNDDMAVLDARPKVRASIGCAWRTLRLCR